jgi:glycerol kinase
MRRPRSPRRPRTRLRPRRALILALDQGTHASRAALFDGEGRMLRCYQRPVTLTRRDPCVEQDPDALYGSLREAMTDALRLARAVGAEVSAAGLATQRSTVVAWDAGTGEALAPALSWQDTRAALPQDESTRARIRAITGLRASAHYGAAKLAWLRREVPAVSRAAARGRLRLGPLSAYLLARLLAEDGAWVDHANAARSLLFDLATRGWSAELCTQFGIETSWLPTPRPVRAAYGMLREAEVPVTAVSGDQSAALFAEGTPPPDTLIANLGSGAFALRLAGARPPQNEALLATLVDSDDDTARYALEGTVNGAGSALAWANSRWGLQVAAGDLDALIAKVAEPPLFVNTVGGLGSPWWRSDLVPELVGDPAPDCRAQPAPCLAAVMESIAFLLAANIERLREAGTREIRASGGLSRCATLLQHIADLTGLTVHRAAEREATLRGIAWLAGGRPEGWSLPAADSLAPRHNPALRARYARLLDRLEAA